jgi:SSS family solute:Na+ symporter
MHPIDWTLIAGALFLIIGIGVYTQQYTRSVADFMSAGRVASRYLLAVGRAEMQAGAVVYVAAFEMTNHTGYCYGWWGHLPRPFLLVVGIFGFVVYRYRETRAMTLGQFFEIRYSKRLRLFAGFLGFFAGLLNFGIIPVIGARVMVYFLGLPQGMHILGFTVPTYTVLMAMFLSVNLFVTLCGGIITIIMTNCAEAIVSQVLYLVIIFGLLHMFSWHDINATLADHPHGYSYLNPFDSFKTKDFNIWMVLMGIFGSIYGTMAWQNQSAYNSAPLTAHEGVMGGLLGSWRGMGQGAVIGLLAVCAMTYLHDPAYSAGAAEVRADLARIPNTQTQEEMEIPVAITHILPAGMRGALCTVLLLGIFGGDSSHLHSWGGLFIQDVVIPLRRKPFTPHQHIRLLRWSIAGVALFVFLFGIFFHLTDYIGMWWSVTMSIFVGGAGSLIIGGLYWKKATTAGAWTGLLSGFVLSMAGISAQQIYGKAFLLNGVQIGFFTMLISLFLYAVVSLLTCREDFNMDRMLHRGAYAKIETALGEHVDKPSGRKLHWGKIIGYNENFTLGDKWIAGGLFAWMMVFFSITVIGTIWYLIRPWPLWVWSGYWHVTSIFIPVTMAVITCVWFTWGGITDSIDFFRRLRAQKVNPLDDGFVSGHQNLDEINLSGAIPPGELKPIRSAALKS